MPKSHGNRREDWYSQSHLNVSEHVDNHSAPEDADSGILIHPSLLSCNSGKKFGDPLGNEFGNNLHESILEPQEAIGDGLLLRDTLKISSTKKRTSVELTTSNPSNKRISLIDHEFIRSGNVIYRVKRTLSVGYCGDVKLAKNIKSQERVALKSISKCPSNQDKGLMPGLREFRVLELLHHPHIVRLYDVLETKEEYILVMEYLTGGELFHYIANRGRLKEKSARRIFRQILSAVAYCHDNFVAHRDLKPENIMLDHRGHVKLIDFDFCNHFAPNHYLRTFCGSPNYAAPEIVQGIEYEGPEVDVWSLGVLLYVCICGKLPFKGKNIQETCRNILECRITYPDYLSTEAIHLLVSIFKVNTQQRAKLPDIIHSKWVNLGYNETIRTFSLPRDPVLMIDPVIFEKLLSFGYEQEASLRNLQYGKNNAIRAIYYLLQEMRQFRTVKKLKHHLRSPSRPLNFFYSIGSMMIERNPSEFPVDLTRSKHTLIGGTSSESSSLLVYSKLMTKNDEMPLQIGPQSLDAKIHRLSRWFRRFGSCWQFRDLCI